MDTDKRYLWVKDRISKALEMPVSEFDSYFSKKGNPEYLTKFFSTQHTEGNTLYFGFVKTTEEVEVTEQIEEEVESTDPSAEAVGGQPPLHESASSETTASNSSSNASSNTETATSTEPSEPTIVETKVEKKIRTITKMVEIDKYSVYTAINKVPTELKDVNLVALVRTSVGEVPRSFDKDYDLSYHFDICIFTGDALNNIANLIHQLYCPLFDRQGGSSASSASSNRNTADDDKSVGVDITGSASSNISSLKYELVSNITKLEQQLRYVVRQAQGDSRLTVPNIPDLDDVQKACRDYEIVSSIETALEEWTTVLSNTVELELIKAADERERTPLGEIEFWRKRNANLSVLHDQIMSTKIQNMLQIMSLVDSPQLSNFNYHFEEMSKYCLEARDNVKFLSTLERHFRHIQTGSYRVVLDSLPSMVNGLRMVWVISRHYNTDERMGNLTEIIADTLVSRVQDELKLSELFLMDNRAARLLVQEARDMLQQWSESYFATRRRIEETSDHRWEFDRKVLFGRTDYLSEICSNIVEVFDGLEGFKFFLGPQLRALTGEGAIENVLQMIESLVLPFQIDNEHLIFEKSFEHQWGGIMKEFRDNVKRIEKTLETFMQESFGKLRSAEGALELIQTFMSKDQVNEQANTANALTAVVDPNAPPAMSDDFIKQQISGRYRDILNQYTRELESIKKIFKNQNESPPVYKNFPPVAGAIAWARNLYQKVKRPILKFKVIEGLTADPSWDAVKANYLGFARTVDNYITDLFNDWEARTPVAVAEKLKQPVLKSIFKSDTMQVVTLSSAMNGKDAIDNASFVLPPPPYRTSFSAELAVIIKESKYLDKLEFRVPESALNVTLQESKYKTIIRSLDKKLVEYDAVMASLEPIEKELLKEHINELNKVIKTGFYPLNWLSQRISTYIEELDQALLKFASLVDQVHKNSDIIRDIVKKIASTQLLLEADYLNEYNVYQPMELTHFFDLMETNRSDRLDAIVQDYNTIGDTYLVKIEEIVMHTNSGNNPHLAVYYHYWERALYNAITEMVIRSMAAYMGFLQCKEKTGPLIKVVVSMNGKDLVVSPNLTEIDKVLTKGVRNMAESARGFVRWMNGTCIRTEQQIVNEDEEPFVFSYYQDLSQNNQVVKLALSITSQTSRVSSITNKYLDGWRRYDKVTGLWNPKRKQQIEKLRPICSNLDSAMNYFQGIQETVESQAVIKDVEFLQIDMSLVQAGVAKQAQLWKSDYGEVLLLTSRNMLTSLQDRMTTFENQLNSETTTIDELKFVLNTISNIHNATQDVELEMLDIVERYRTLIRYRIEAPEVELNAALNIEKTWRQLYIDSKTRDMRLVRTKDQFRAVTVEDDLTFRKMLSEVRNEFLNSGPGVSSTSLEDGVELLADYKVKINKITKEKNILINAQNLFGLDVKPFTTLQQLQSELEILEKIYGFFVAFKSFQDSMANCLWADLDINGLQKGAEDFDKQAKKFPKELKENYTFKKVEEKIYNFRDALPLVISLKNDAMKTRHWQKLMDVTGVTFDVSLRTLTLYNIFAMELHKYSAAIEEIINEAVQEAKIEQELLKIENYWRSTSLTVVKFKKDGQERGLIVRPSEELKLELEDNMLNLQTINGSRFVGAFVDRVKKWEKTLAIVNECLEAWYTVQRKWMYLEGIFIGADDIRMQLPEEAKKFDGIDKAFKAIMAATNKNPNVVDACTSDNRLQALTVLSERLDTSQKSLSDYLNTKRASFPRFFFISDDELLSVLGSSDASAIQVHLLKLFDNVKEFQFGRNFKTVEGMGSVEKEAFQCRTHVNIEGPIESWMTACETEMHNSLRTITKEGVFVYASHKRTEWLKLVLGMVGLVGSQIWWTWETEDTFRQVQAGNKYAMKELESRLTGQLNDLVAMVRDKLDSITRKKVNTLLIIDVHARDIVDGFVRESILNAKEFAWESQLRFYWDRDVDDCIIRQCTGKFRYGYEYMGLNGRLVITPLTDRCYMTLTQALTFKLGGSPSGPAGTGKTETTKDLAKSLALPCFVINCGDGLDYKAMASIFSGLVQVGAWGCFDEFNRINIEVLSVVSAQLRAIQNSLLNDKPTCDIGIGGDMLIKRVAGFATCGFFITMNPGYAGRTELPDNLKALFRPVTMIVPDFLQICEIMLFSEGFEGAKVLAKKMTVLYKLSKEQLSKQFHYDFGLRALKSVLVMAGGLKRQYQEMSEELVLMRCLRDSNLPKFVFEDVPLFTGLIGDLFPGMDCPRVGYEDLKAAAGADLESRGYKCSDAAVFSDQIDKVVQMYETQLVRHTTMIVGPTGGGKSLVLQTLKNARLTSENIHVKMSVLNPKAQPLNELYGEMDPATRDWTDGILSRLFRELNAPLLPGKENEMRWIIFDGDVDALWVENMNSVMDDNKLLTLPNGERIRLQPHCAMICETFDLQYASPATISRCGMVWVDPKNLGYAPFYERWIRTRYGNSVVVADDKKGYADMMMDLYHHFVPSGIDRILFGIDDADMVPKLNQVIPISNLGMVIQLTSIIDMYSPLEITNNDDIRALYVFGLVWSLGGALLERDRVAYDIFLKKKCDVMSIATPVEGLLYDYFFNTTTHAWQRWQTLVPQYAEPKPFRFYEVMVPTTDSVLYSNLLSKMALHRSTLFVGESGTAKTTIIQKYLSGLSSASFSRLNINFSSRTTAADVQVNIEANVDKKSGTTYGPPTGKKLMIFIDDLNMPKVDTYGTQQPIALLHFLMSRHALYDRAKDLNLKTIKDLRFIGAMGPPGGGKNPVDTRFVALFNVFNLTPPNQTVLESIYSSILDTRYVNFSAGIKGVASRITSATLKLHTYILENMPATPAKFHYIFNLRDISRVYEGLCNATTDIFTGPSQFLRLWRNECDRVFYDRLTTVEDHRSYNSQIQFLVTENFPEFEQEIMADPMMFGDFLSAPARLTSDGAAEDLRLYQDLGNYSDVHTIFSAVMEHYNSEGSTHLTLVLFEQALEHLCRIHRIIRNPRGNALLVGVGGSGKQSLTRLATHCAGYKLFQISLSRGYGEEQFKTDLKELYKLCGQSEVVFMFTDAHVVEEGFLEFINNMLTTGMVPSLYDPDEKDMMCNSVRQDAKAAGLIETPDILWNYFVDRCRNNLHIVLAMSPSGSKLRLRCRNFPGLISATVIDWFFPWSADALQKVAEHFIADVPLEEAHRDSVVKHLVFAHQNITDAAGRFAEELRRHYYVTPKNYLDFLSNYRVQLATNEKQIQAGKKRLEGGLQKLIEASSAVDRMKIELIDKKVIVDEKTISVQELISVIQEKTTVANAQQEQASVKQKYAEEQTVIITQQKQEADEALLEALPAVEAASRALENLDKKDLTELKAFANPPAPVKTLCRQLCYLRPNDLKIKLEDTWEDAKKMLGNGDLLKNLKGYPKDDIQEAWMVRVKKLFTENGGVDESLKKMESASAAGFGLLTWVVAIVKYYDVAKNVNPLRNKVKEMEKAQRITQTELAQLQEQLKILSADISELNTQYAAASHELDILQQEAALMTKQLNTASKLIEGLTGEKTRWGIDIGVLEGKAVKLVGDCLLGASFLSYLGAFTTDYRRELLYGKFFTDVHSRGIPVSTPFSLEALLTTDSTIQSWSSKGLPADEHSIQNGILTTKSSRFPLCIDPQQQAVNWIKRTYAEKNLTVKTLSDSDFMKHLELAIQFGNPFLFENVDEELDPMLDPVLEKAIVKMGTSKLIKLGDKMVEWDDNFKLFFTTKLANPHYSPEVMGKTMIINYGVTMEGLANQLLNVVVAHERPDLEKQWSELVADMSENAQLLVSLEDTLLFELSSSQGNILDNQDLIATLDNTKTKAVDIQSKLTMAEQTKEDISVARSAYKPVAKRGSILYFAEAGLATISSMYELSLDSFLRIFNTALAQAKKDQILESRLRNMIETIMRQIYDYTCTGIFEKHKLMFSFQMTCMIMVGDGNFDNAMLDFFLKGDISLGRVSEPVPVPWMIESCWKDLLFASTLCDGFAELLAHFRSAHDEWKTWYDLEAPESTHLPNGFTTKFTPFQRLAIMRCFRPDRVYNAVKLFVIEILGEKFVQPPVLDYHRIFQQSSPMAPMVFILSPGADPQSDIQKFCDEMGMTSKFKFVALGQGQGPIAEHILDVGYKRGHWVLLQNCHLLTSWLKVLEKTLASMKDPHKDFRLWLTTEPTDRFPLGILQRSLKVVTEPPDGLKLNMRATYSRIDNTMLDSCPHWAFRPCLYVLAFLHAVVLERRKYGKIGWNVNYDFNESDFNISRRLVALYLEKSYEDQDELLPWGSLKYLIGDAMYGGRVSDDMDRRVLKTYLEEYMGDFLFDDCQKFRFSKGDGFEYVLPAQGPVDNYTEMIETFALTNSPAVFGLHPNAEIGYYSNAVKSMWVDLISLQPRRAATGEGMSREDHIAHTAHDIQDKVPIVNIDTGSYDLTQIRAILLKRNGNDIITPCQVVLLQELERWNNLVRRMVVSLSDLQRALRGEIGMSDELESLGESLYNGFLPAMWRRLCPSTQKPLGGWMVHFLKRYAQYEAWIHTGEPAVMWLAGLHIPESYLTALVQTTCRKRGWPLDKSTLYTVVTKYAATDYETIDALKPLESGCYVSGLYLEGASWDNANSLLRTQDPKVLVEELPIMQIIPVEATKLKLQNTFRAPVYVTQDRRNAMGVGLVFEADLATHEHSSHWVLQGVALSLNIDS